MLNTFTIKLIHVFCLVVAMTMVVVLPAKKEIWYDETVSMLCSKGISADEPAKRANVTTISSAELENLNTAHNVFDATVTDNANSYLYNITLHWYTSAFGNSVEDYMTFSKICAILALLAFYVLCTLFFGNSLFTPLTVILLATDLDFIGMSHEIRAYIMGILFVSLAGVCFFRFLNKEARPVYLFFMTLFCVGAVLSHFLSVYVIIVFCLSLLVLYRQRLFSIRNIVAVAIPVLLVGIFFYYAYPGLQIMSKQNARIHDRNLPGGFDLLVVVTGTLKFIALNFKAIFPAFMSKLPVILLSFLGVVALYIAALKSAVNKGVRQNLHLLFALGVSSSLFLAFLCIKSGHYTALYYRYHSFSIPFSTLFTAYAVYVVMQSPAMNRFISAGLLSVVLLPPCVLFIYSLNYSKIGPKYNHPEVAAVIVQDHVNRVEVPTWEDAFLLHCVMPVRPGFKIDYVRNQNAPYFTLYSGKGTQQIPVLVNNN